MAVLLASGEVLRAGSERVDCGTSPTSASAMLRLLWSCLSFSAGGLGY